jgi:hypothetical protein
MNNLSEIKIRWTGTRPLVVYRGEAANPFDPQGRLIKTISQKRKKADEDFERLAELQFRSSLYYNDKIGPYLPTDNIWKALQLGAAKYKEGPLVKSQVVIKGFVGKELDPGACKLLYDGPRDLDGLYKDRRFTFLKMGKPPGQKVSILVSRARFLVWAVEFQAEYFEITKERFMDYNGVAGRLIGVGTWRPQHGLFTAEIVK